jgi:hypothetical protein
LSFKAFLRVEAMGKLKMRPVVQRLEVCPVVRRARGIRSKPARIGNGHLGPIVRFEGHERRNPAMLANPPASKDSDMPGWAWV